LTKGGKTPGKGTPAPKAAPAKAASKPMSSHSNRSRPRTGTSQSELAAMEKARQNANLGVDDQPKNWDFRHYNRVLGEMQSGSTSVGSILAAIVF
jgi:hypothetical protein